MKTTLRTGLVRIVLALGIVAGGLLSSVQAQPAAATITVDENGNGTLLFAGAPPPGIPLPPGPPDIGPGAIPGALSYSLVGAPGLTTGDLLIVDAGGTSDLIRFNADTSSLIFYSVADGPEAADKGIPLGFYPNLVRTPEGPGGVTLYTPIQGQPGFVAGFPGPVTYEIHSTPEAAPDAGSCSVLLGLALTGLLSFRRFGR